MTTALTVRPDSLPLNTVQDLHSIGELMAKSGCFEDARAVGQACVKILAGKELGFGAMASMTGVHFIEGKPTIGAHLMASLIKRSGKYDYKILRCDREACELEFFELGEKKRESVGKVALTYTDAEKSGWTQGRNGVKDNWRKVPDDMLFSRCISKGFRRYCPDLSSGVVVYVPDEMDTEELGLNGHANPPEQAQQIVQQVADSMKMPEATPAPQSDHSATEGTGTAEPARITEEQADVIRKLIRETNTDAKLILGHYKAKRGIPSLPASAYQEIVDRLTAKKQQQPADPLKKEVAPGVAQGDTLVISAEQAASIPELCKQYKVGPISLQEFVGVKNWSAVPLRCWTWLKLLIQSGPDLPKLQEITRTYKLTTLVEVHPQEMAKMTRNVVCSRIDKLCEELLIPMGDSWAARLTELFGERDVMKLTVEQLEVLMEKLEQAKKAR